MSGTGTSEIERRFVPDHAPSPDGWGAPVRMRQGYLAEEGDVAVRVRIAGTASGSLSARLTVKAGAGLERVELDLPIDRFAADALWPSTYGRRIDKRRYRVALDDPAIPGLAAEVDFYDGALDGLCTVEVEFTSVADAERFVPPSWFGRDVTGIKAWTNASLARYGVPPGPP